MTDVAPNPSVPADSPFVRVPDPLRQAMEERGFTRLTPVQAAALDALDGTRDLRISSQTGSGKTVALGLAIAGMWVGEDAENTPRYPGPRALVIVPTRELAKQVQEELSWLFAKVHGLRVDCVTGGTPVGPERRRLSRNPALLVGTPGRLLDHIESGALDCGGVSRVVLDEADQMLDMGFRDELEGILGAVPTEGRRTHMLSATFPKGVLELATRYQSDPLLVEGTAPGAANTDITHVAHTVFPNQRYGAVLNLLLLAGEDRTLLFVATRADTARLASQLTEDGFAAAPLSGDLAQAQRTRTLDQFRKGTVNVLVATDVAARGIDVPEVSTVIHCDLPMDAEVYTHRSGRTGRAGRKGRSVLLTSPNGSRRARFILRDAKVDAEWSPVPSADAVQSALRKRSQRRMRRAVRDADAPTPAELELAHELLADRPAEEVVAALLSQAKGNPVCQPVEIDAAPVAPEPRGGRRERHTQREGRPQRRNGAGKPSGSFTTFRINWGFRNGANPRRILAAVCRRGDVTSKQVGAIHIGPKESTFDVTSEAAADFGRRASRRDDRDPGQRIEACRGTSSARARYQAG